MNARPPARILIAGLLTAVSVTAAHASDDVMAACLERGDQNTRLVACELAITLPNVPHEQRMKAHSARASLLAEAGRHRDAIKDFSVVIENKPGDAGLYAKRGLAYLVEGDHARAIADLSTAIELRPGAYRFHLERGYANLVAGHAQKAVDDFNTALKYKPKSAVALNNRGLAFRKLRDHAKAMADFNAALRLNPIYALAYLNRAYLHEEMGKKELAVSDFQTALEIDPSSQGAIRGLGRLGIKTASNQAKAIVAEGKALVEAHCGRCHSVEKKGDSPLAEAPPFRALVSRYPLIELRDPISRGIAAPHEKMPKFKLTDRDIDRIAAYVGSL